MRKALEAIQASFHCLFTELAFFVDASGQLNLLPEALENADFGMVGLGHNHVKAVGAKVDGGDQGQVLRDGLRHDLVVLGR
ncbi:hypothetical protein D3C84_1103790 [compost metagenome]